MRFKFLTGDVNWKHGGKFISNRLTNGEFSYWLIIEIMNWEDATGEPGPGNSKYNVSLSAVSPDQAGAANIEQAFGCCGMEDEALETNPIVQVECLHSYGIFTQICSLNGSNLTKLMRGAREEAQLSHSLFGSYMDRPVNRIGTTGWEAIKGDMTAGLRRTIASGSVEGQILGKMHGIQPHLETDGAGQITLNQNYKL